MPSVRSIVRVLVIGMFLYSLSIPKPAVKIKKSGSQMKFKVRCTKYLYTLVVADAEKANKLKQSLPPGRNKVRFILISPALNLNNYSQFRFGSQGS
jgi:hypothetical protein